MHSHPPRFVLEKEGVEMCASTILKAEEQTTYMRGNFQHGRGYKFMVHRYSEEFPKGDIHISTGIETHVPQKGQNLRI